MTRRRPSVHGTRAPRTRTTMIAGTLVAVVSCWSLFVAAAKPGSNARSVRSDGELVRRYGTSSASGEHCCSGQSSSTAAVVVDDASNLGEIPLNVIMELNQVTNVSELFNKYIPDTNMDEAQRRFITTGFQKYSSAPPQSFLKRKFTNTNLAMCRTVLNMERKAAFIPKPASCSIGSQTISLKDTDDRSLYYFPSCTRVDRCGGCCSHDLLACQPTKTETLHFEVLVSQYNGEGKLEFKGRKTVAIDRHLKCKCGCVIKEEDCGPLQTYNVKECLCKCSNEDEEEKCNDDYNLKQWNSATCKCECREIKECTSGYGFDNYTCGCEPIRIRTKNNGGTQMNRNKYSLVVS